MAARTAHFAQRQLIERRKAFFRKHWWRVVVVISAVTILAAGLSWIFPTAQVPVWFAAPALFVAMLVFGREQFDGTYHLVNALEAEGWTSRDLRRWLGKEWHVVDSISFESRDVDHVVVGPGGVFAVETKSTDSKMDVRSGFGRTRADAWIQQAVDGGHSVYFLLSSFGYRLPVTPIVVVWGQEVSGTPLNGEVPVVRPKELKVHASTWLNSESHLSREQVDEIRARLLEYRAMRASHGLAVDRPTAEVARS